MIFEMANTTTRPQYVWIECTGNPIYPLMIFTPNFEAGVFTPDTDVTEAALPVNSDATTDQVEFISPGGYMNYTKSVHIWVPQSQTVDFSQFSKFKVNHQNLQINFGSVSVEQKGIVFFGKNVPVGFNIDDGYDSGIYQPKDLMTIPNWQQMSLAVAGKGVNIPGCHTDILADDFQKLQAWTIPAPALANSKAGVVKPVSVKLQRELATAQSIPEIKRLASSRLKEAVGYAYGDTFDQHQGLLNPAAFIYMLDTNPVIVEVVATITGEVLVPTQHASSSAFAPWFTDLVDRTENVDKHVHKIISSLPATPTPGPSLSIDDIVNKVAGVANKGIQWATSPQGQTTISTLFSLALTGASMLI